MLLVAFLAVPSLASWTGWSPSSENTRSAPGPYGSLSPATAARLQVEWELEMPGSVTAVPVIDDAGILYAPDWSGKFSALDAATGAFKYTVDLEELLDIAGAVARTTPSLSNGMAYMGLFRPTAWAFALDMATGALVWKTQVDAHPEGMITSSPVEHNGLVYYGVSSWESVLPFPADCCYFRGSVVALSPTTGEIVWKTYTIPEVPGLSGGAVWGSQFSFDDSLGLMYFGSGQMYTVPEDWAQCEMTRLNTERSCLPEDVMIDSLIAVDAATGAVAWHTRTIDWDVWNTRCIAPPLVGLCPDPLGYDFDFGQAPAIADVAGIPAVVAGAKSGFFYAVDRANGTLLWKRDCQGGGFSGGFELGSAVAGDTIYAASTNSEKNPVPMGSELGGLFSFGSFWVALDKNTGEIRWRSAEPNNAEPGDPMGVNKYKLLGPILEVNGVLVQGVTGNDVDNLFAVDAATGRVLWSYSCDTPGGIVSGASALNGVIYIGCGNDRSGGNPGKLLKLVVGEDPVIV